MRSITVVDRLYQAFRDADADGLLATLSSDFTGHVSAGMPCEVGGRHDGPVPMLTNAWARVFAEYDVAPIPETIRTADDGTVVVHGWYTGTHRPTGRPVRAEFVHLIRVDGDRVAELRQITDTNRWREAD